MDTPTSKPDHPTDAPSQSDTGKPEGPRDLACMIDVVIVTANTRAMTIACVQALQHEHDLQVIVVDNGSSDGTAEALRSNMGDHARIVELDSPVGFASACNRGAELGAAPFVLFLNSDILALPGSIKRLLEALQEDPSAVASGGRLVDPDTLSTQPGYRPRRFPTLASFAMILIGAEKLWPGNPISRRYHAIELDEGETQAVVAQPAAAALMARRSDLQEIGGFDERFWFWFEDSDLLRRLSDRGRILWVPSAPFRHIGGASFSSWDRVRHIRSLHHGMLHYAACHFSATERRLLGLLTIAVSLPRIALFSRFRAEEAQAWRAVARAGGALLLNRPMPAVAPGP